MNKLQIWFSANDLHMNSEKSAIIVIPSKLLHTQQIWVYFITNVRLIVLNPQNI